MAESGKEELHGVKDTLTETENADYLVTNGDTPIIDMEYANKELEAARKAHKRLTEEKIALTEALNSRRAKIQVQLNYKSILTLFSRVCKPYLYAFENNSCLFLQAVLEETNQIEQNRNDLQRDINAVREKLKLENEAIEEMKLAKQRDLAESESLEEYHKHLRKELEKREILKEKRDSVMRDLYAKIAEKKKIVSNLLKGKESLDKVNVNEGEPEDICNEEEKNVKDEKISQRKMEEDLQFTREKICEMEKRREELTRTVLEKNKEMEMVKSKIKDVETINIQKTSKLEDLENTLAKLDYQVANERNKNRILNRKYPENLVDQSDNVDNDIVDEMKVSNADHEFALYDIKQRTDDVLSNFDEQMKALKRTKKNRKQ